MITQPADQIICQLRVYRINYYSGLILLQSGPCGKVGFKAPLAFTLVAEMGIKVLEQRVNFELIQVVRGVRAKTSKTCCRIRMVIARLCRVRP